MDSEDDMLDANDLESVDDDFYSGETEYAGYYDSEEADPDYEFIEEADDAYAIASSRSQVNFLSSLSLAC